MGAAPFGDRPAAGWSLAWGGGERHGPADVAGPGSSLQRRWRDKVEIVGQPWPLIDDPDRIRSLAHLDGRWINS